MQNLRSVTTQYINFVKENYTGKVASNINVESLRAFVEYKAQEVSGGTLSTYLSTLNKMADNLHKDHIGALNREAIQGIKEELKSRIELKSEHENRAYSNVEAIRQEMSYTPFSLSTELQIEVGLRAGDAINSEKWTVNVADNTLIIHDSKGGLTYQTAPLSSELINKVAEAKELGYKIGYTEYWEALKDAVTNTGQKWTGTHGLRYSFAQERLNELRQQGYTHSEAKGQVSLELGHSRLEITDHYLGR